MTDLLVQGSNCVGMMIAHGWAPGTMAIAQLHLHYANGSVGRVVSDATWQSAQSPVVDSSVYNGETYA